MTGLSVIVIFLIALVVRFLYFPDNVYFSFDQARDSFTALEILKGDLKIIGPPSFLSDKLFPGPLIFYIYAPIYFLFDKSPEAASAFFRIFNAAGVLLVFLIGKTIFNKRVGIMAAFLFAISYEQSQYSLYLLHQPLAVISVLLFYLGLSLYIFNKERRGLVLAAAGWGLSMQFHYGYIFLGVVLLILLTAFRNSLKGVQTKYLFLSLLVLLLTTSTFFLMELKYHFFSSFIIQTFSSTTPKIGSGLYFKETLFTINRFLHDTFLANYQLTPLMGLVLIIIIFYLLHQKKLRAQIFFLIIWFFTGLSLYLASGVTSYYYSAATSVSLLILVSYIIHKLFSSAKIFLAIILTIGIIINNLVQISIINPQGLNSDMAIQPGMLTSAQKQALDYIYTTTNNKPFAVRALTIPLSVNTTWSYLFEWYGKQKYHYLPIWIGPIAEGFPGNLTVSNNRGKIPKKQFLIIEPTVGIREGYIQNFFREEGYFTKLIEEKKFGTLTVQLRQPY